MSDKWRPKPPPRSRAGALGFIFVLLLFVAIAAAIFLLNPFAATGPGSASTTPTGGPTRVSPASETPKPGAPGQHWDLFLPLIRS